MGKHDIELYEKQDLYCEACRDVTEHRQYSNRDHGPRRIDVLEGWYQCKTCGKRKLMYLRGLGLAMEFTRGD